MRFIINRMIKWIFILEMKINEKWKTLKTEIFILGNLRIRNKLFSEEPKNIINKF
jgi:hypothetical protein